jgi:hypothetical protein
LQSLELTCDPQGTQRGDHLLPESPGSCLLDHRQCGFELFSHLLQSFDFPSVLFGFLPMLLDFLSVLLGLLPVLLDFLSVLLDLLPALLEFSSQDVFSCSGIPFDARQVFSAIRVAAQPAETFEQSLSFVGNGPCLVMPASGIVHLGKNLLAPSEAASWDSLPQIFPVNLGIESN